MMAHLIHPIHSTIEGIRIYYFHIFRIFGVTIEILFYRHTLRLGKDYGILKSNQLYICAQHIQLIFQVLYVDKVFFIIELF